MEPSDTSTQGDVTIRDDDAAPPRPVASPRIGRYRVDDILGQGGMGTVYRAFDDRLDRSVALKLLHGNATDTEGLARLAREAQALARLAHPNVVSVFEVRLDHEPPFVVMEYVEGDTLDRWLRATPRGWRRTLAAFEAAGRGLRAAHAQDVVHRDFKPQNVIVGRDGRVRVLDFGLATGSASSIAEEPSLSDEPGLHDQRLTQTGAVMGTPAYMAPEQHTGQVADALSDQFSFCVALYEGLHGQRPFGGRTAKELLAKIYAGTPDELDDASQVPHRVRRIVLRGLARDPAKRWPSMDALLVALHGARQRSRWVLGATALGIATIGALGLAWMPRSRQCAPASELTQDLWGATQQRRVATAFDEAGLDEHEAKARVHSGIAAYADDLAAATHRLCLDASDAADPAKFDHRSMCLASRRLELDALIGVLSQPSSTLATGAPRAVSSLTPVHTCDAATNTPTVPSVIAEPIAELRRSLADAGALEAAGLYKQGLAEAIELVAKARELGFDPALAEALLRAGRLQAAAGRYDDSRRLLEEAYLVATESKYDAVAIEAATKLVRVVGHEMARHDEGFTWVRHARSLIERGDVQGLPRARLLRDEGSVWHSSGEYRQARARHQDALEIFESELGSEHPEYADTLLVLGHTHWRLGDFEGAMHIAERARRIYVTKLGSRHPMVAEALNDLGLVASKSGKHREAIATHLEALDIRREALGDRHAVVGRSYYNLGSAKLRAGQEEGAVDILRQAVSIREQAYGEGHPDVINTRSRLGMALALRGDTTAGLAMVDRALQDMEALLGPDHPRTVGMVFWSGKVALIAGDPDVARHRFEQVIERERSGPSTARHLARALAGLGSATLTIGDPQAALERFERADELQRALPTSSLRRGETLVGMARACAQLARPSCVSDAARRADAIVGLTPRQLQMLAQARARAEPH